MGPILLRALIVSLFVLCGCDGCRSGSSVLTGVSDDTPAYSVEVTESQAIPVCNGFKFTFEKTSFDSGKARLGTCPGGPANWGQWEFERFEIKGRAGVDEVHDFIASHRGQKEGNARPGDNSQSTWLQIGKKSRAWHDTGFKVGEIRRVLREASAR